MKSISVKAVISSLMILVFVFLAASGAMLYFGKTGVVLGFARSGLRSAHTLAAVVMCLLALVHFIMNRRQYIAGLRSLAGGKDKSRHT